ncbi:hypothetical protein [Rhizobium sp. LC145]|uniref:hypothetical protein n=1 Tax=Rhizobium sp. LC145 TaxID=1120688 RepID=UPI00062A02B7|nr:hypothetical protein [Rhizobium sp. LC145]KKX25412.1 hypothetical protein YH62_26150 [Rhizobium sp. LC145]TKT42569.1 hypothetical protein FDR95_28795 [Rhizobiaceae bacterium LC148]
MRVSFSPQRRNDALKAHKSGDIITLNGESFDFSELPAGATIPAGEVPCEWIVGPVERIDGEIHLTLILPHGPNPSSAVASPAPLVSPPDGVLDLPRDPRAVEEETDDVET